ncbi:MAG TPA: peptidylprolyl isomerase, partial [Salinimicrobium sp.]|nr:peptidylprolyl isomerase [Salinimicrobium sp.]
MAVLNKIRQRSVFLIIIIALALFSFVLADVIRNGGMVSQKSRNTIASINGEDIQREEFAMQVEAYQNNTGSSSTMQAVNVVWDINVRQALLEEQFEELGIKAGEAQIKKMLSVQLAGNPNFSNELGMFDENKVQEYVATLKATSPAAYQQWVSFEKSVAESARENIYFNMVRAGLLATVAEGEQLYKFENSSVDLQFVEIPYTTVPDSQIEVSKADIKAYMEEHPEQFQSEATRDIRYVLFSEEASAEDQQQVKTELTGLLESKVEYNAVTGANDTIAGFNRTEDIETFVNTNSDVKYVDRFLFKDDLPAEISDDLFSLEEGETFGPYNFNGSWRISKAVAVRQMPDSAKARHILIAFEGSPTAMGTTRTKEEAAALADSLVQVVRQDETKFAELASEFSTDMSNKQSGGELGWFAPGVFVPAFNDFIFSNEEGEVGVVESEFGYHVVHIQEMTEPQRAVKLATIVREIQPSEKTLN